MKLSKMVEENITDEELETIEEKKYNKKLKASKKEETKKGDEILVEEDEKYCAKCGATYSTELTACPECESEETTDKCGAMQINIAKAEAIVTADSAEDPKAAEANLATLKAAYEEGCVEKEETAEETKNLPAPTETVTEEVVTESTDGLLETPATADETAELEYLKSLSGI